MKIKKFLFPFAWLNTEKKFIKYLNKKNNYKNNYKQISFISIQILNLLNKISKKKILIT